MKKQLYKIIGMMLMVCLWGALLIACSSKSYLQSQETGDSTQVDSKQSDDASDAKEAGETATIWVQVSGAVVKPGVYEISAKSRVYQAIEAAGGFAENADTASVNQAMKLTDEQQLVILTMEESARKQEEAMQQEAMGSLVNLNTASKEQLMTLTGVGEAKADAIIAYRTDHGGFTSTDEIMNISGIKEGAYNKIKNNITVN